MSSVIDGTATTLFVGEAKVGPNLPNQWMDPWSITSTVLGVNTPGYNTLYFNRCFSSYHPGGAQFVFVDGSVHFISDTIDLFVLSHLGTRAKGEPIGQF